MSPLKMGIAAGVLVRLYRALTLSVGPNDSLLYIGAAFVLGQMIVLGMVTLHLGNFTVRRWLYLTPAFAAAEIVAESVAAAALIAATVERLGSIRAVWSDWPGMVAGIGLWRLLAIVIYATVLAGVVQLVRYINVRREHREHTLEAVTQEHAPKGE